MFNSVEGVVDVAVVVVVAVVGILFYLSRLR